jgi:hypothetical protein
MKPEPQGVHSRRFHDLDPERRRRFCARALARAPIVTLLDARLSLNTAASIKATVGRIGFLFSDAIALAIVHDADLAVVAATENLQEVCELFSVRLHQIQRQDS